MAVDAIIFDFDGVIIDTETPDLEVWQEFYRTRGLDLPISLWARRVGYNEDDSFHPAKHFEKVTGAKLEEVFYEEQMTRYIDRCAQQPLRPGVARLLQQAAQHGIKLAIASSSYHDWVGRWIEQHKLTHYFSCIRTRDNVEKGKPAPDLYLSAAQCLGVPVERCIAIEDSPTGMTAALAAGIRCIAVLNDLTMHLDRPTVALTLYSLDEVELPDLLSQF